MPQFFHEIPNILVIGLHTNYSLGKKWVKTYLYLVIKVLIICKNDKIERFSEVSTFKMRMGK